MVNLSKENCNCSQRDISLQAYSFSVNWPVNNDHDKCSVPGSSSWYRIHRGYKERALFCDGKPEITKLIFAIHGIGQKDKPYGIVEHSLSLHNMLRNIISKDPNNKESVTVIPIEWRSKLKTDDNLQKDITLPAATSNLINSIITMFIGDGLDIKDKYVFDIIDIVRTELNEKYRLFMKAHPEFNGPISIFAHSLGAVIAFEILERNFYDMKLDFHAKILFTVGSSLGMFLIR
uniref:DDHD domain-containing protein n=1 Tax=Acrobeloides nanus TaxID=290746 RepID=A0A914C7R4_9BILA